MGLGSGCGGWWPRLEDTVVGMFLSRRTYCLNSPEGETEGVAGPVVAVPKFQDVQRVGLSHTSPAFAPAHPFSLFPGSAHVPPHSSCPRSLPALPLPPARTQTLLGGTAAKDELQKNFRGLGQRVCKKCMFWQRWQCLSIAAWGSVARQ